MRSHAASIHQVRALLGLKRYEEVLEVCKRVDGGDRLDFHGLGLYKGQALEALKHYEEALDVYRHARYGGGTNWRGREAAKYYRRAGRGYIRVLIRLGRYSEMLKLYREHREWRRYLRSRGLKRPGMDEEEEG
jgi:tetratricopeptide (TPR) repeat protein